MWKLSSKLLVLYLLSPICIQAVEVKSLVIELNNSDSSNNLILNLSETPKTTNLGNSLFVSSRNFSGELEFNDVKKFYYSSQEALSLPPIDASKIEIDVYPNPCTEYLYISSNDSRTEINCYDVNGKNISLSKSFDGMKYQINLQSIPQGTYLLIINNQSFKFVKR